MMDGVITFFLFFFFFLKSKQTLFGLVLIYKLLKFIYITYFSGGIIYLH